MCDHTSTKHGLMAPIRINKEWTRGSAMSFMKEYNIDCTYESELWKHVEVCHTKLSQALSRLENIKVIDAGNELVAALEAWNNHVQEMVRAAVNRQALLDTKAMEEKIRDRY